MGASWASKSQMLRELAQPFGILVGPSDDDDAVSETETVASTTQPSLVESVNPTGTIAVNLELRDLAVVMKRVSNTSRTLELLHRSALVTLVTFFETMLADCIRRYFELYRDSLSGDDKILSFNELKEFESLEDAIEHIIDRRVDSILPGTPEDWGKFLEKMKISLLSDSLRNSDQFSEIFARRNLIVHRNGVVDKAYIRIVGNRRIAEEVDDKEIAVGERLYVSERYLDAAVSTFGMVGLKLIDLFWTKLDQERHDERDKFLSCTIYEIMLQARWDCVIDLCSHGLNRGCKTESSRLVYQMNYWLAHKRLGRWKAIASEIGRFDADAVNPRFAIAVHSLRDDATSFFRDLPVAVRSGVTLKELKEWPILEEMRRDERFTVELCRLFSDERLGDQEIREAASDDKTSASDDSIAG
jgi:hypothetical protein